MSFAAPSPPRYEIKIPAPLTAAPQITAWIRHHWAHWRETYPPRWVNSLYFDDDRAQALIDNLSGVGARRKLRLRWYGDPPGQVSAAHLEIKAREGRVGWKHLCPLPNFESDLAATDWPSVLRSLRTFPHVIPALLRSPRPVLIVRYRRSYYQTANAAIRLTIDRHLHAYDQRRSSRPNLSWPAFRASYLVIEFKTAVPHADFLAQVLADFPHRPRRHSKYVLGSLSPSIWS